MDCSNITDDFSISGAITLAEVTMLHHKGVTTLINSRINAEEVGQLPSVDYLHAAETLGMHYVFIPVTSLEYPTDAIQRFGAACTGPGAKVHAFCRTGKRVTHLWALSQASQRPLDVIVADCTAAGLDISPIMQQLTDLCGDKT
jgi:uncharacterized protein (TIGR01244 family)